MRKVYHATEERTGKKYVLKRYHKHVKDHIYDANSFGIQIDEHARLEAQKTGIASYFAQKFSEKSGYKLNYVPVYISSDHEAVFIEEFVDVSSSSFLKYVNNNGLPTSNTPQKDQQEIVEAFVHFSLHSSGGQLMVADIQGWFPLLCDPEICTLNVDGGLGTVGNHNKTAINNFSNGHTCSQVCRKLGLTVLPAAPAP